LGVAEAGVGLVGQKIDAGKAALRKFIPAGKGHAVASGAKFVEVDHLALSKKCNRSIAGVLPLWGFSSQSSRDPEKL
jgi:hypothetical protein